MSVDPLLEETGGYRIGGEQDTDRLIEDAVMTMVDELRAIGLDDEQILREVQARTL